MEGRGASIALWEHATISQVNDFTVIVCGLSDDFLTLREAGQTCPFRVLGRLCYKGMLDEIISR